MSYDNVLKTMNLDKLIKFKSLNIEFDEVLGLEIPYDDSIGFPPALIPIASSLGSFSYTGAYLKNIENKEFVFVDLLVESNNKIYELALNEEQFIYYFIRRAMVDYYDEDDEEISYQIQLLCKDFGIDNYMDIAKLRDDEYLRLEVFKSGIPKYLLHGETGFSHNMDIEEFYNPQLDFDKYILESNFQKAWECLNKSGWVLSDAKKKFQLLVEKSENKLLLDIYNVWSNINHPVDGY